MTGVVNSVSTWLTSRPPTMLMPSGWRSSEPVPVPNIRGHAPKLAASGVLSAERRAECRARARAEHQRQRAENRGDRRHEYRAKAQQAGLIDRITRRKPF